LRKWLYWTLIAVLVIAALTIVYVAYPKFLGHGSTARQSIVVVDALNRTVVLNHPARRIVVLDDNQAEQVLALGAAKYVVAVEDSIPRRGFFDDMATKPTIGNQWRGVNYELISRLRPDLVILVDAGPTTPIIAKLESLGIQSFVTSVYPEKIPRCMLELGKALGKEDRAKEFVEWWNKELSRLKSLASRIEGRPLKVFVAMTFAPTPQGLSLFTCGARAAWNYWFKILHLENVAAKYMKGCGRVSLEWLARVNPDVIIVGDWSAIYTGYMKNSTKPIEELLRKIYSIPILSNVSAIENHRVFVVDYQLLLNIRSIVGAFYLGKALYPEIFRNVDPDALHAYFFKHWFNEPYRGIWFYPEPWRKGEG